MKGVYGGMGGWEHGKRSPKLLCRYALQEQQMKNIEVYMRARQVRETSASAGDHFSCTESSLLSACCIAVATCQNRFVRRRVEEPC